MIRVKLQGIKTSKITDLYVATTNDYKRGSKFIVFKIPDLPLRLPCHHFFCACLYSPPRSQALIRSSYCFVHVVNCALAPLVSRSISSDSVLPCSPCVLYSICCGSGFCLQTDQGLIFGILVVALWTLWRFLRWKRWEQQSSIGVIAIGKKRTISLSKSNYSFWSFRLLA